MSYRDIYIAEETMARELEERRCREDARRLARQFRPGFGNRIVGVARRVLYYGCRLLKALGLPLKPEAMVRRTLVPGDR